MAEIKNHRLIVNRKKENGTSVFEKMDRRDIRNKRREERIELRIKKKEARRERMMNKTMEKYGIGGIVIPIKPKHDRRLLLIKRLRLAA